MMKKCFEKRAFTLAELLIVVAIIAVLVAIGIPVFTSQLEKSREAVDLSNIRFAYTEVSIDALEGKDSTEREIELKQAKDGWQNTSAPTVLANLGTVVGTPTAGGKAVVDYGLTTKDTITIKFDGEGGGSGDGHKDDTEQTVKYYDDKQTLQQNTQGYLNLMKKVLQDIRMTKPPSDFGYNLSGLPGHENDTVSDSTYGISLSQDMLAYYSYTNKNTGKTYATLKDVVADYGVKGEDILNNTELNNSHPTVFTDENGNFLAMCSSVSKYEANMYYADGTVATIAYKNSSGWDEPVSPWAEGAYYATHENEAKQYFNYTTS